MGAYLGGLSLSSQQVARIVEKGNGISVLVVVGQCGCFWIQNDAMDRGSIQSIGPSFQHVSQIHDKAIGSRWYRDPFLSFTQHLQAWLMIGPQQGEHPILGHPIIGMRDDRRSKNHDINDSHQHAESPGGTSSSCCCSMVLILSCCPDEIAPAAASRSDTEQQQPGQYPFDTMIQSIRQEITATTNNNKASHPPPTIVPDPVTKPHHRAAAV